MRFIPIPAVLSTALLAGGLMSHAHAEFTLNAGAKLTHESNINGSPTSTNRESDTYGTLSASAVYYTALDPAQTSYFIGQVGALSSIYNKFDSLDNTLLVASAGLYQQLSPAWSGQVTGRGFTRNTKQNARDSDGFGATLEIKNQLSPTLWIKGIADYEDSEADLNAYSYKGKTLGLNLGYLPMQSTFVNFGYSHVKRDFDTATSFNTTAKTVYADVTQQLAKNWYLNGGYAFQKNDSNIAGTDYNNHIVSLGVNFSY